MSTDKQESFELVDVITSLRANIEAAMAEGDGKNVRFGVSELEVELQTVLTKSSKGGGSGGVEFSVLGLAKVELAGQAEMEGSKQNHHIIRMKLKPWFWDKDNHAYTEDGLLNSMK